MARVLSRLLRSVQQARTLPRHCRAPPHWPEAEDARDQAQRRAADVVAVAPVARYAAGIDAEDGRIAAERLADFDAERTRGLPADEAARPLGL